MAVNIVEVAIKVAIVVAGKQAVMVPNVVASVVRVVDKVVAVKVESVMVVVRVPSVVVVVKVAVMVAVVVAVMVA